MMASWAQISSCSWWLMPCVPAAALCVCICPSLPAGKQAEVLNQVIGELLEGHPVSDIKLKEVLGHTPLQVRHRQQQALGYICENSQGIVCAMHRMWTVRHGARV
jgi:hypothetical protein